MAEKEKAPKSSVKKLESDLKATEEQALLYAKDLARIFAERKEKERQLELTSVHPWPEVAEIHKKSAFYSGQNFLPIVKQK